MRRSLHRVTVAVIAFVSLSGFVLVSALDVPVAAAASGASPRVTLVSSGNSPRSPLRLALTEGTVTQATMEFSESIKQSLDGKPTTAVTTPPIQVVLESTVGPVSSEGNAQVSYAYRDVTVVDDGSTSATRRDQLETGLAPLTAVTTSGTVTTRNAFVDFKTEGTEGLDPSVAQILNQLTDQFSSLSVPFPREAVGTGARWRATTSVRVAGIDVQQSYIYRLRERQQPRRVRRHGHADRAPPARRATGCAAQREGRHHEVSGFRERLDHARSHGRHAVGQHHSRFGHAGVPHPRAR